MFPGTSRSILEFAPKIAPTPKQEFKHQTEIAVPSSMAGSLVSVPQGKDLNSN